MPRNKNDNGGRTILAAIRIDGRDGDGPVFYDEGDEMPFQEEVLDELDEDERQAMIDHLTDKGCISGYGGKADDEDQDETKTRKRRKAPKVPRTPGRLVGKPTAEIEE